MSSAGELLVEPVAGGRPGRRRLVVTVYVALFLVALPGLEWRLGGRMDEILALPTTADALRWLGYALGLLGIAWMALSMWWLSKRGRGLPISHLPPRSLVGGGPYLVSRHPIYLGYVLALAGFGLAAGSLGRAAVVPALTAFACLAYVVGFEEPALAARYGDDYDAYRAATPLLRLPGRHIALPVARRTWRLLRRPLQWLADRPVLLRRGDTIWTTYGAVVALAVPPMIFLFGQLMHDAGYSWREIGLCAAGFAASMVLGARVVWLVLYAPEPPWRDPRVLRQVGFVSWGVYLGLIVFGLLFAWARQVSPLWVLDRAIPVGLLGSAIGRLGCVSYGCCYGRPARGGIRWHVPDSKVVRELGRAGAVGRIPTQLLSSVHAFAVAATVLALSHRPIPTGAATGFSMVLYGLGRFTIESLRDPANQALHRDRPLTTGQVHCVIVLVVGIVLLLTVKGAPGWTPPAALPSRATISALWPAALLLALLVFVPTSLHRRQVGRW
jgi:prolipoprotein diacylglyceryltransferase/protein-S-isoprenylcysteine O-methyltransferase Ste14